MDVAQTDRARILAFTAQCFSGRSPSCPFAFLLFSAQHQVTVKLLPMPIVKRVVTEDPMGTSYGSYPGDGYTSISDSDSESREYVHTPYATGKSLSSLDAFQLPLRQSGSPSLPKSQKQWKHIPMDPHAPITSMTKFPPGWKFSVFNSHVTMYYEVPSENVQPTHGAIRYIEHFNEAGPYTKFRFQLCHNHRNGLCRKGFDCTYIHAMSLPRPCTVHVNGLMGYNRLPAGLQICVHPTNSNGTSEVIASENILLNFGSERAYREAFQGTSTPQHPPQHCAHFRYKRVCNLGDQCAFIHTNVTRHR